MNSQNDEKTKEMVVALKMFRKELLYMTIRLVREGTESEQQEWKEILQESLLIIQTKENA